MTGRSALCAAQGVRDANHGDVEGWYRSLYCLVHDVHALGGSFPDLLVGIPTRMGRVLALVKVKTADGPFRRPKETFIREWGTGCVETVQTREDVFAHVERVRSRSAGPWDQAGYGGATQERSAGDRGNRRQGEPGSRPRVHRSIAVADRIRPEG